MPVQLLVLRILLGLMCVAFAYFLGRSIAAKQEPKRWRTGPYSWALRTFLAGLGVTWRTGLDVLAIVVFVLAALAAALGLFLAWRPKKDEEDLSRTIFPGE